MTALFIALVVIAVKLPLVWCCWYIYKTIHDVPEPEIDRSGGDFVKADFEPGPRVRGPHGGSPSLTEKARRGDKGHDETITTPVVHSAHSGD
jgi:hypothetical protein